MVFFVLFILGLIEGAWDPFLTKLSSREIKRKKYLSVDTAIQ
jgi:hypothetical protein